MVNGSTKTIYGKKIYLYRANTITSKLSNTEYLPESKMALSQSDNTPSEGIVSINKKIPIQVSSVIDNGENTLVGTDGGDNTTNNNVTYKPGASQNDNISQNLLANDTSVNKQWELTTTNSVDITKYFGLWLYFNSQEVLDKIVDTDSIKIRIGTDSNNYYEKIINKDELVIYWNFLCNEEIVNTWQLTGTITTTNYLSIIITTNNAEDIFEAGEVCYDLAMQWTDNDLYKDFSEGYPTIDFGAMTVTKRTFLNSVDAVGFEINKIITTNDELSKPITNDTTLPPISKSDTDQVSIIEEDMII